MPGAGLVMFTIHCTPYGSTHIPNSSPQLCFPSGTTTVPPSDSRANQPRRSSASSPLRLIEMLLRRVGGHQGEAGGSLEQAVHDLVPVAVGDRRAGLAERAEGELPAEDAPVELERLPGVVGVADVRVQARGHGGRLEGRRGCADHFREIRAAYLVRTVTVAVSP
jgi:hypothetical protein